MASILRSKPLEFIYSFFNLQYKTVIYTPLENGDCSVGGGEYEENIVMIHEPCLHSAQGYKAQNIV